MNSATISVGMRTRWASADWSDGRTDSLVKGIFILPVRLEGNIPAILEGCYEKLFLFYGLAEEHHEEVTEARWANVHR